MTVKLMLKGDGPQELVFEDDERVRFTAQGFPDGHLEVTRTRRGTSHQQGVVVESFTKEQVERVDDSGWPSDNGPF